MLKWFQQGSNPIVPSLDKLPALVRFDVRGQFGCFDRPLSNRTKSQQQPQIQTGNHNVKPKGGVSQNISKQTVSVHSRSFSLPWAGKLLMVEDDGCGGSSSLFPSPSTGSSEAGGGALGFPFPFGTPFSNAFSRNCGTFSSAAMALDTPLNLLKCSWTVQKKRDQTRNSESDLTLAIAVCNLHACLTLSCLHPPFWLCK